LHTRNDDDGVVIRRWKNLKICLFISTECTNVTDGRTDRQTPHEGIGCACVASWQKRTVEFLELVVTARDPMHGADYDVARCLSVCLSVRHTRLFCRNISSKFLDRRVATPLWFCRTVAIFRREPPHGGIECRGICKNIDFWPIYLGNDTQSHRYYGRRIGNRTQDLPVSMTFSDH